jgi:hypothetical protein
MAIVPVYLNSGAIITWADSLGTYDMTNSALASGAARVGEQGDLGAGARPPTYVWQAETQWTSAPTLNQVVELYLALWADDDGAALPSGQVPASDTGYASGAAGVSKFKNLIPIGAICAETAAVGPFSAIGEVRIPTRYVSPFWINRGTPALATSTSLHKFRLIPKWPEGQ